MIQHIHIKHMALIDDLEMDLTDGLNVLTGETGAGKSIILESIETAMGARSGKDLIRDGADFGLVELVFSLDANTVAVLQELERELETDLSLSEELIISRRVYVNRSVNRINDTTVTIQMLKRVAALLLDIHSQQEHQSLMKEQTHLQILDRFDGLVSAKKGAVSDVYDSWMALKKQLDASAMNEEEKNRQISLIQYEIREIEEAELGDAEEEALEEEYRALASGRDVTEDLSKVYSMISADAPGGAGRQISEAYSILQHACGRYDKLEELYEQIGSIDGLLRDFEYDLRDMSEKLAFDPETFDTVERRLNLIHHLESKYGKTVPDVLAYLEERQKEYEDLLHADETREALLRQEAELCAEYTKNAKELSQLRKAAAERLEVQIKQALQDLNFLNVEFRIALRPCENPTRNGLETVSFLLSTNVGEELKPLSSVASGGELSRIMLAVKSCLAREDQIPTLIFDEIDTGISGRTAQKVSEKLYVIAGGHQVLCISHLPQIAAMADANYRIEKRVTEGHTVTEITPLDEQGKIEELARMLGGVEITDAVRQNAEEMLRMALEVKNKIV